MHLYLLTDRAQGWPLVPEQKNPTPKYQPLLRGTSDLLCHSHLNREEWDQPSYIPLPLAGQTAPGNPPQPWQADGDHSGKYRRRELLPPPP